MKAMLFFCLLLFTGFTEAQSLFPDKCIGRWEGMMHIAKNGVVRDSVAVLLTVAIHRDAGAWSWKMEYLSEKMPATKDYVLRLKDAGKNWYITDEGDGIELNDYVFGNKMYCVFETEGFLLTSSYELRADELIFEVSSGKKMAGKSNSLTNFSVDNLQRVVFKRKN